jgi:hypothetical protein
MDISDFQMGELVMSETSSLKPKAIIDLERQLLEFERRLEAIEKKLGLESEPVRDVVFKRCHNFQAGRYVSEKPESSVGSLYYQHKRRDNSGGERVGYRLARMEVEPAEYWD